MEDKDMTVLVIDGQGGKLGRTLVEAIKGAFPDVFVWAVGTNANATGAMLKGGADRVSTGENPVLVACRRADIIAGPVGIAMADALMGEISPAMANAVASANARRVLIPMNLCDTYVAGIAGGSGEILEDAIARLGALIDDRRK